MLDASTVRQAQLVGGASAGLAPPTAGEYIEFGKGIHLIGPRPRPRSDMPAFSCQVAERLPPPSLFGRGRRNHIRCAQVGGASRTDKAGFTREARAFLSLQQT